MSDLLAPARDELFGFAHSKFEVLEHFFPLYVLAHT